MRRSISRPCSALPMRRTTYSPQYGLGRGRRTVACMSLVSSVGERVERVSSTGSLMDNASILSRALGPLRTGSGANDEPHRLSNLVEEFLSGLADALHAVDVPYRQIRMGHVPAFCCDLVLGDPVFHLRAANPRPAFTWGEEDVHLVGYLRREVIDIGIPLAVVGSREEQLRVVVQEHETHVVDGANPVRVIEVAVPQLQQRAQPRGPARCERGDQSQFRDLALTASGPTGAFHA